MRIAAKNKVTVHLPPPSIVARSVPANSMQGQAFRDEAIQNLFFYLDKTSQFLDCFAQKTGSQ